MLTYLSKKISIPNQRKVKSLAWSQKHGYIACGAESGLLKVLKLDDVGPGPVDLNLPRSLAMNQTLEGHNADVISVIWNERYEKLTSSDASGLIIVWVLYKGSWYEEMVNNRNKSIVIGMSWTQDGMKICIVYEDGAVIVGSVDGNRLWGRDIKSIKLTSVEWSPDGKHLLFGSNNGQVHIYDQTGNFVGKVPLPALNSSLQSSKMSNFEIVTIRWQKNVGQKNALAIVFASGIVQIMSNEYDENPLLIDTKMTITSASWNHHGTLLAITGRSQGGDNGQGNKVKFYDPRGEMLECLSVPGKEVVTCSWEREGLRLAIGIDFYIFFSNIRPDYKWCYFASTLVVALPRDLKSSSDENEFSNPQADTVIFCNLQSNTKQIKSIKNLSAIAAHGQFCVFSTLIHDTSSSSSPPASIINDHQSSRVTTAMSDLTVPLFADHSSMILCNSIGTPVDSVNIELSITHMAINSNRAIAVSNDSFVIWQFKTPTTHDFRSLSSSGGTSFRLTSSPSYSSRLTNLDILPGDSSQAIQIISNIFGQSSQDQITCLTASETQMIFGCASKSILVYELPELNLSHKILISHEPKRIYLNLNDKKLAIIDANNFLHISDHMKYDTKAHDTQRTKDNTDLSPIGKKEVWGFCWSDDYHDSFAVTEKSKLIVYSHMEADESVQCNGFICEFKDLTLKIVLIDNLIMEFTSQNSHPIEIERILIQHEVRILREMREMLKQSNPEEVIKFVESNSNPKLWRLFADSCLRSLNFKHAESALVKFRDYKGIQFAKRVAKMSRDELKRAEVLAYFGELDEAEQIYLECDRKDLAINLRKMIGDWSRVIRLLEKGTDQQGSSSTGDAEMREAFKSLGDSHMDNHNWLEASKLYEKCEAWDELYKCYCLLENYDGLGQVLNNIESTSLLQQLGWTFESAGLCSDAVKAYHKAGRIDLALKACVNLNEWKIAIDLAQDHYIEDIDTLLSQHSKQLIAKGRRIDVIELYRKANRIQDARLMLLDIVSKIPRKNGPFSKSSSSRKSQNFSEAPEYKPLEMKKAYLLVGLLYEQNSPSENSNRNTINTLSSLLLEDSSSIDNLAGEHSRLKVHDQPWKGAEAYHLYLLAQRFLRADRFDFALKSALNLIDYEEFIGVEEIYFLIALAALLNGNFYVASKAFIKLESDENIPEERRLDYQEVAIALFSKNPPKQSKNSPRSECKHCDTLIVDYCFACPNCNVKFPVCMATGLPIMDPQLQWTCRTCKHHCFKNEIASLKNCPFCHSAFHKN